MNEIIMDKYRREETKKKILKEQEKSGEETKNINRD
jgi:hypothetical protein